jgi:hypothetical protein
VPERVRGVRAGQVLLQRRVRHTGRVPPHGVLLHLQVGVPARIQLRLRRPHQHLHLQGRRLHHRLLPPDLRVRRLGSCVCGHVQNSKVFADDLVPVFRIKESDAVYLGEQMNGQASSNGSGPPIYNNGGFGFLPPIYDYGGGSSREPGLTASSATTRFVHPWLLLLLVFLF